MKVLFDTNVVLDLLLDREPFSAMAVDLFSRVEGGTLSGWICATTVTTIHYLATKVVGAARSEGEIAKLLSLFDVAPVTRGVLESALELHFSDYEDAVIHEAARHVAVDAIVTRDAAGFRGASVPVYSPVELVAVLVQQ